MPRRPLKPSYMAGPRWPAEMAAGLAKGLGSPNFGWLSFQTLWDEIVDTNPDFLD